MNYLCPEHIADLFTTEFQAASEGREALLAWLKTLDLNIGDKVTFPIAPNEWETHVKTGPGHRILQ